MERLAEIVAGVLAVLLGPEEAGEGVPAVEAVGAGQGKVDEQRRALGLRQHRVQLRTVTPAKIQGPQRSEIDQGSLRRETLSRG